MTLTAAVIGDGAPASGKTAITVEFTVADFEGKPLAGQEVVITTNNGALPNKITEKTDANGVARIALTNTTDGVTVVTAEVEGNGKVLIPTLLRVLSRRINPLWLRYRHLSSLMV